MIDISSPQYMPRPQETPAGRKSRVAAFAALLVLIIGAALIAWYMLKPYRTVTLQEGSSYQYSGYSIKLSQVTSTFCPNSDDQNCKDWVKEPGVRIEYTSPEVAGVGFLYLGRDSQPRASLNKLSLELVSVDTSKKSANIRMQKTD